MISKKISEQISNVVERNVRGDLFKKSTDREISYGLFNRVHSQICVEVWAQVCGEISVQLKENIVYEIRK
jgi:hypothetical protein